MIKSVERMFPESENFVNELAVSFGGRDEWLQDEELCPNQTEMQAMMTSFARTQSETLLELMKQNPKIKCTPVAILVAQQVEEAGEKPGSGNALVPSGGCVSAGMDKALGLEIGSWTSVVVDGSSSKANEVGKRGRQNVRCIWEANDGANRGRCRVDATLAVEEAFPMRRLRHEANEFHWRDTTEASKDPNPAAET